MRLPFLMPKSRLPIKDVHRVALACFGGLGDVLFFSPVIQTLKHWLPNVHITLYVEARSAGVGSVLLGADNILSLPVDDMSRPAFFQYWVKDIRQRHFDGMITTGRSPFLAAAMALAGVPYRVGYETHPWALRLLSHAAPCKKDTYASAMHLALADAFLAPIIGSGYESGIVPALPCIKPPDDKTLEQMNALKLHGQLDHRQHIMIHPGVSLASQRKGIFKGWAASDWAEFMLRLSRDHSVYLVGGPDDEVIIRDILERLPEGLANFRNLMGETRSFAQLAALMQVMDVVCIVDSAPLHLSVALKKPTLAFFGPTNPDVLVPNVPFVRVAHAERLACRPCLWETRAANCETSECLKVPVELMLHHIYGLMEQVETHIVHTA
jgi:putative inorganic carbon (hco3(-)) transporter